MKVINESKMSQIDAIARGAETREDFKKEVKDFLKQSAHNPSVADDDDFIEKLAVDMYDKINGNDDANESEEYEPNNELTEIEFLWDTSEEKTKFDATEDYVKDVEERKKYSKMDWRDLPEWLCDKLVPDLDNYLDELHDGEGVEENSPSKMVLSFTDFVRLNEEKESDVVIASNWESNGNEDVKDKIEFLINKCKMDASDAEKAARSSYKSLSKDVKSKLKEEFHKFLDDVE